MARRPPVVLLLLAGCASPVVEPEVPTDWADDLARLDQSVAATGAWADADPRAWTRRAAHARALAERGKHRGSPDDLAAAQEALDVAFTAAKPGSGPWLDQARLDFSLHRFPEAEAAATRVLSAAVVKDRDRAEALGLLGRSALEREDLGRASALLTEAHALDPTPTSEANLAVLEQARDNPVAAEAHWEEAAARCACPGTRFDGWVALQRGLVFLDADPAAALPWFEAASERYSGDWVFQEHQAETLAATGQLQEADQLYQSAVATVRDPEVLGAWAGVKRALGEPALADALIAEARTGFEQSLDRFPEAAAGHAVDFFAEHGPQDRALQAARIDARVRPTADRQARVAALEGR